MVLKTSQPNMGSDKLLYKHCPNCTKGFRSIDGDGKEDQVPPHCKRCGCPMYDNGGPDALAFSEAQARGEHQPALAAMGAASRGYTPAAAFGLEQTGSVVNVPED